MYNEFLNHLDRLQENTVKPGLERITEACARLGHPEEGLRSIHIAGTNGKGSTAAFLESILRGNGYRVGLYTSPHLTDVRERMQINRELISGDDAGRICRKIMEVCRGVKLSYFEFLTILAFIYFAENNVDVAILETGMGGRLDSTNVVSPILSILTPISIDHTRFLGGDLRSIAREKCGIIKEGVPVVSSVQEEEVMEVIRGQVLTLDIHDIRSDKYKCLMSRPDPISLPGEHQRQNASLAICAANILNNLGFHLKLDRGMLSDVVWPGRLQKLSSKPEIILDGAHNPAACRALRKYIETKYPERELVFIFGAMRDKDISGMIGELKRLQTSWVLFDIGIERAASPRELEKSLSGERIISEARDEDDAVKKALGSGLKKPLIVVAGSLYLVGRFIKWSKNGKNYI